MDIILSAQNLEIFGQLFLAAILGILIGTEREIRSRGAGMRTHALVCLGACLFTIISTIGFDKFSLMPGFNPAMVASQVVVGIGFIGAGLIIFQESKIQGLTTAAGIWATAAIGMAVALKLYFAAFFTTFLVLFIFTLLFYLEIFIDRFRKPS